MRMMVRTAPRMVPHGAPLSAAPFAAFASAPQSGAALSGAALSAAAPASSVGRVAIPSHTGFQRSAAACTLPLASADTLSPLLRMLQPVTSQSEMERAAEFVPIPPISHQIEVPSRAGQYALLLLDLARERGTLDALDADLQRLAQALDASPRYREFFAHQVIAVGRKADAMHSILAHIGVGAELCAWFRVLAENEHWGEWAEAVAAVHTIRRRSFGEVDVEIVSAAPLTDASCASLLSALKERFAHCLPESTKMVPHIAVNPSLISGYTARFCDIWVDESMRSKLLNTDANVRALGTALPF